MGAGEVDPVTMLENLPSRDLCKHTLEFWLSEALLRKHSKTRSTNGGDHGDYIIEAASQT